MGLYEFLTMFFASAGELVQCSIDDFNSVVCVFCKAGEKLFANGVLSVGHEAPFWGY